MSGYCAICPPVHRGQEPPQCTGNVRLLVSFVAICLLSLAAPHTVAGISSGGIFGGLLDGGEGASFGASNRSPAFPPATGWFETSQSFARACLPKHWPGRGHLQAQPSRREALGPPSVGGWGWPLDAGGSSPSQSLYSSQGRSICPRGRGLDVCSKSDAGNPGLAYDVVFVGGRGLLLRHTLPSRRENHSSE